MIEWLYDWWSTSIKCSSLYPLPFVLDTDRGPWDPEGKSQIVPGGRFALQSVWMTCPLSSEGSVAAFFPAIIFHGAICFGCWQWSSNRLCKFAARHWYITTRWCTRSGQTTLHWRVSSSVWTCRARLLVGWWARRRLVLDSSNCFLCKLRARIR